MTLPSTGALYASQVNAELGRVATAPFSLNDSEVRRLAGKPTGQISFADLRGKTYEAVAYANSRSDVPAATWWFSDADLDNGALHKRLIIPAGVEIGAPGHSNHAIHLQHRGWRGTLTIENYGVISGRGGAPNSGWGGDAFWANGTGWEGQKATLRNFGVMRGGGGGGGRGGDGGTGVWFSWRTIQEGPLIDFGARYFGQDNLSGGPNYKEVIWADVNKGGTTGYSFDGGDGWIYGFTERYQGTNAWYVYRKRDVQDVPNYTGGGAGGSGGRGQGYDGLNTGGQPGAPGGTNAGAGGHGGWGNHYGGGGTGYEPGTGLPGAAGSNGNSGGGTAGAAGGLAGCYLSASGNISFFNSGTLQGRIS